jgi:2-C-methyl-D-erythritol 4-phosphate cytidylyltransferase
MRVFCGILASGTGERFSNKPMPKQLEILDGSIVFTITLKKAQESGQFDAIVVSVIKELEGDFIKGIKDEPNLDTKNKIMTTYGGKTRMDSILLIIEKFKEMYTIDNDDILCLSDASRPLIDKDIYASVIKEAITHSISCPSKELVDGVGLVENGFLTAIPDKVKLHTIQTPEACNFKKLINLIESGKYTNKLGLCEIFLGAGIQPKVVESNHKTYKVTLPADIKVLEALIDYDSE